LGDLVTQTAPVTTAAPSGQVTSYAYDPAGNEVTEENPDGATPTNTFTPLNQLASVTYSAGTHNATYTYDADGNQTGMFDASGISSSTFDPFDELTSTTNGAGQTTSYAYDLDGDVTGITYPLGSGATWASTDTVAYTYDHADQLASVTDFNGHTSNVTVSADGLPTAFTLGASGDTVSTSYAANDAPSSITLVTDRRCRSSRIRTRPPVGF
jgi:YD repeat-containing protein